MVLVDSTLLRIIEGNLSEEQTVKLINVPEATVEDTRHYILPITRKIPRCMNFHVGAKDAARNDIEVI